MLNTKEELSFILSSTLQEMWSSVCVAQSESFKNDTVGNF